jgi:hypothetical protein
MVDGLLGLILVPVGTSNVRTSKSLICWYTCNSAATHFKFHKSAKIIFQWQVLPKNAQKMIFFTETSKIILPLCVICKRGAWTHIARGPTSSFSLAPPNLYRPIVIGRAWRRPNPKCASHSPPPCFVPSHSESRSRPPSPPLPVTATAAPPMRALVRRAASLLRVGAAAAGPAPRPRCPPQRRLPDAVCRGKVRLLVPHPPQPLHLFGCSFSLSFRWVRRTGAVPGAGPYVAVC